MIFPAIYPLVLMFILIPIGILGKEIRLVSLFIIFLGLFLALAFQDGVGTDYYSYIALYDGVIEFDISNGIGFKYLLDIMNMAGLNHDYLFVVISLIQVTMLIKIFNITQKIYSRNEMIFFISLTIIMIYISMFNILRASVGSLFFAYALLKIIIDNNIKKFLLYNFLAILFHPTFILFLIIPFILKYFDRKKPFLFFFMMVISFILLKLNFVQNIALLAYELLPDWVPYKFYLVSVDMKNYTNDGIGIATLIRLLILMLSIYFYSRETDITKIKIYNFGYLVACMWFLFSETPIFFRIVNALYIFQSFLFFLVIINTLKKRFAYCGLVILLFLISEFYISLYRTYLFNGLI